jgi:UDP-3-O-[3-hydroxymyristoyl] N-acetylglucosamine deacetylase
LLTVQNDVFVGDEKSSITAKPPLYQGQFMIEFEIDFDCKQVGFQKFVFEPSNGDCFASQIAHAKTFALKKDYDYLKSIGYALGGRLSNGILLESDKIHNPEYLTYKDDFVRHKILDFIGDLYTSGHLFSGRFFCKKSGHKLSNILLKSLFKNLSQ